MNLIRNILSMKIFVSFCHKPFLFTASSQVDETDDSDYSDDE